MKASSVLLTVLFVVAILSVVGFLSYGHYTSEHGDGMMGQSFHRSGVGTEFRYKVTVVETGLDGLHPKVERYTGTEVWKVIDADASGFTIERTVTINDPDGTTEKKEAFLVLRNGYSLKAGFSYPADPVEISDIDTYWGTEIFGIHIWGKTAAYKLTTSDEGVNYTTYFGKDDQAIYRFDESVEKKIFDTTIFKTVKTSVLSKITFVPYNES